MIHKGPAVLDVRVGEDAIFFAVVMSVDGADLPGVSVKGGAVFVVGAEEVAGPAGLRTMRFDVEAERASSPWTVAIVCSCGDVTVPLAGPLVPPLSSSSSASSS